MNSSNEAKFDVKYRISKKYIIFYILFLFLLFFLSSCSTLNEQITLNSHGLYSLQIAILQGDEVRTIFKNNKVLTRQDFIEQLDDTNLQNILNQDIKSQGKPIYFETTKLSQKTKNKPFYYSLTAAPTLNNATANIEAFSQNNIMQLAIKNNKLITNFENLNKTSTLIVPTLIDNHIKNTSHYISLYSFIKHPPKEEIENFWSPLGW